MRETLKIECTKNHKELEITHFHAGRENVNLDSAFLHQDKIKIEKQFCAFMIFTVTFLSECVNIDPYFWDSVRFSMGVYHIYFYSGLQKQGHSHFL